LLKQINQELAKYRYSFGWNSTSVSKYNKSKKQIEGIDSDLSVLHARCQANGIQSPVGFDKAGISYIKGGHTHIDLYNVFSKSMIQNTIFKNSYRTLKLDEVSRAVLGNEKGGKYEGLDGTTFSSVSTEKQKQYVLKDAQLVMDLATHNNSQILDCMNAISKITGLDLERVCRTSLSSWWTSLFDNMVAKGECIKPLHILNNKKNRHLQQQQNKEQKEEEYVGATVLEPQKGFYQKVDVVDVISLYPTMAILHNISFDTVNCWCCRDNPKAKVDEKITKDCKFEKGYWICQLKEGAFAKKLKIFREERIKEKKKGSNNIAKQLALKVLINGGYGVFGNNLFAYQDKRVAELITAFGRYTLDSMHEIAKEKGFEVVAGDTDSLFLLYDADNKDKEALNDFIEECKDKLNVDIEHQKTYDKILILKKKHYFGITDNGEIITAGMEANKSDRPLWINNAFKEMLEDIFIYGNNPLTRLKEELQKINDGKIDSNDLKIQTRLSLDPQDYKTNNISKKVGMMLNAKAKDSIYYYKTDNKDGVSINPNDISIKKYEKMLIDSVKEILDVLGYDLMSLYS
jgi:DNA polymerase elongation subunit (family B)